MPASDQREQRSILARDCLSANDIADIGPDQHLTPVVCISHSPAGRKVLGFKHRTRRGPEALGRAT
jgi:hypothetical protein